MGADRVYFYFGVKRTIALRDEDQIRQLEEDTHPLNDLAYDNKLHFTWGCLTDGADYFLLIDHELGCFGVEGIDETYYTEAQLADIVAKTKERLRSARILEPPTFIVQLQAQF